MLGEKKKKKDSKKNDKRADKCKKLFERKAREWNRSERENWVGRVGGGFWLESKGNNRQVNKGGETTEMSIKKMRLNSIKKGEPGNGKVMTYNSETLNVESNRS